MFYSASTNGFYSAEIHGKNMPSDAVEISAQRHADLLAGQTAGLSIAPGADGFPVLLPAPEQVIEAPQVVTMRQARLALLGAGLLDSVNEAIAAIPDATQRRAAEIEWEYAQTVDRASPFTQQLASGLGLTSEQLDSLFTQAAAL